MEPRMFSVEAIKILKCIESCRSACHYSVTEKWLEDLYKRNCIDDFVFLFAYNRLYIKAKGR